MNLLFHFIFFFTAEVTGGKESNSEKKKKKSVSFLIPQKYSMNFHRLISSALQWVILFRNIPLHDINCMSYEKIMQGILKGDWLEF